ncbi:MAG: hypothetical protein WBF02_16515, partial [Xanthobacteraceae bacterium]
FPFDPQSGEPSTELYEGTHALVKLWFARFGSFIATPTRQTWRELACFHPDRIEIAAAPPY